MSKKIIGNYCTSCKQETHHDIEATHTYRSPDDDYDYMVEYEIVKCKGCDTVSFRKTLHDIENAYPTDDDEWQVPKTIECYPRKGYGNIKLQCLPTIVKSIYSETCSAFRDGALTLAGIGFRATIEAICNDQKISGKELSNRINNLAIKGLISKKDSTRLHSIRFLGNDAAHDILKPSDDALVAALIIVEHLLTTVYVLDEESSGKLDSIIEEYSIFEKLLVEKLKSFSVGDQFPIQKFFGKDIRLISGSTKQLERELATNIGQGKFKLLKFGKKDKFLDSKEQLQHYIVEAP